MNRFKTKKKTAKEEPAGRPSQDSDSFGFRFRKGKKNQEEQKPEVDLASALPPTDDFRTSLLMTGLSARFSMLREQDDPNTKIGKASDDSVLFPKRQSRMMDLGGYNGLSDIAEVESIKSPFARMDSYVGSDSDSINGSIMNRSKPIEGNVLFGGRQKIYKIAAGATSTRTVEGGMGGRALYDDDVALSAFQKWRKEEKELKSLEGEYDVSRRPSTEDQDARPESPFSNEYNRKRETTSTTSSIPSMARNSTAATSVTSQQPSSSIKDWQAASGASMTATSTPPVERSTTRTRRLYETGLNNDLHEQQSSALSRIDTLTRRRDLGSRTPDPSQTPSPTAVGFMERFGDRRILAKASAPNLRSMSPASRSSAGTPDLGIRVPSVAEAKPSYVGTPPLSPPISEADELSTLPIQPNDRGKATALGVFAKPAQPYDESRFAERQLQLQQGRETPTQRFRAESSASFTGRSRSSSSANRQPYEPKSETFRAQSPLQEETRPQTFFSEHEEDADESPVIPSQATLAPLPSRTPRPADSEHPALRGTTLPTPLSMASKSSGEPSPTVELDYALPSLEKSSPPDSPTLGPVVSAAAGLSGMVRQHLRADSGASSIYGGTGHHLDSSLETSHPAQTGEYSSQSNQWEPQESSNAWSPSHRGPESPQTLDEQSGIQTNAGLLDDQSDPVYWQDGRENDEFASQLADGARRIRERLTTYVESDSRPNSPPSAQESREMPTASRSNTLGILQAKSSRGSLADRSRDPAAHSKAMKMLGISDSGPSVLQRKASFERPEVLDAAREGNGQAQPLSGTTSTNDDAPEEQNNGIKAFRQARRELQKLRELETQQRHHTQPQASLPEPPAPRAPPPRNVEQRQRSESRDRRPPPVAYRTRAPSEDSPTTNSRSASQEPSRGDRDRSGSNSSGGERPHSRSQVRPPMRLRSGSSAPNDRNLAPQGINGPMSRSPGLPGTNIRRSPIMPPQGYPGGQPARANQGYFGPNGNLNVHPSHGYDSNQPSPISPIPSPFANSAPATPGGLPSPQRPPLAPTPHVNSDGSEVPGLNEAMKRPVKKRDISEPTFVMSTSRVPTVELPPEAATNRSRSNSRSPSNSKADSYAAPPLPPINPRRRQDTLKSRTVFGNLGGRGGEASETANLGRSSTMPMPTMGTEDNRSPYEGNNDEYRPERRPLRKMPDDVQPVGPMMRVPNNNNAPAYGPPASRMVVTQNGGSRGMGVPGGMI